MWLFFVIKYRSAANLGAECKLDRGDVVAKMSTAPVPHTLPVVLSREETARLIESAANLKYQAALSVAYGAGLRISEVIALKVGDIDSTRMTCALNKAEAARTTWGGPVNS